MFFQAQENILIFSLNVCSEIHSSEHSEKVWDIRLICREQKLHTRTIQATAILWKKANVSNIESL